MLILHLQYKKLNNSMAYMSYNNAQFRIWPFAGSATPLCKSVTTEPAFALTRGSWLGRDPVPHARESDRTGHQYREVIGMKRKREPRILPRLGTLPAPHVASRFPHIQALIECGGQVSLERHGIGGAVAFGAKGMMAAVRTAAGEDVQVLLQRLDWAIAIGNSTRVRVDEMFGATRVQSISTPAAGIRRAHQFPKIQSLLDRGGAITFGHCKPGAAVASINKKEVAILASQSEEVVTLLRRLDWNIGLAESQGSCIDEVFQGATHLPTEQAGAEESTPEQKAFGIAEPPNHKVNSKGIVERLFSVSQYGALPHRVERDHAVTDVHLVGKTKPKSP
jgi:hypothetical protein